MCFFQDEKNKPRKIVLGVPEVSTRHSGTNIAAEVLEIIDSYGIKNKIGYFTLDNAENNDSAMAVIGGELGFDGRKRRGRCFGHILNLSAKALLFGSNPEAFENQLSGAAALSETEHDLWRRGGPAGKLHNLVVDIDRSDVLSYLLRGVQQADMDQSIDPRVRARKPLNIVVDNDTRWLSQLYMIRRAIKLRPYLDVMILKHKQAWEQDNRSKRTGLMRRSAVQPRICLSENQLSNKDWDVLEHLARILGFYEVTVKTLEGDGIQRKRKRGWVGSYGNIWDVIQGFEFLMAKLEEYKAFAADYPDPEHFRININLGWQKLNKYYTILDETPIYYVALALHPAYRWGWFEEHWGKHPDWIATAKEMVQEVWETEYRNLEVVLSPGNEPVAKRRRKYQNAFEEYCEQSRYEPTTTPARMRSSATPESPRDEYEAWQQSWVPTDTDIRDPIAYWQDNRAQYPRLSRMALDFLTIQPMSAECERLFSAAGRLVTPLRSRLEVDIIGMCLVLRSWLQAKIIDDLDPLFVPTQIEVESSARSKAGARESMASFLGRARELAEEENGWE
ncbi:putative AC9 transposase [Fusarium oxysporum f. sp. raphani]|uniref:Putative AC9 transposase n=1 Tax=Fusarium oxysporum f. sp. raphani TaxID=96318 RepID=A0A8J5PU98_FUSOX|nr:putative AC9 transposase [Fusarium oxysporum f. sp. raphani]KAG7422876.1 putative AC9 transposase [Fusarium oxysporum f. sp. raphani]KAG7422892.1 putative AC9 transposase [Fusarium oxysporum f. sp. raphani]KAG7424392.1 putative AC9 transposase [Fusarium oxysporum f. sp. raphani]KAG7426900.1 putative AC9 transposase [Fusarium oxysporum f. sp. raphani]